MEKHSPKSTTLPPIVREISRFLEENPSVTERQLAIAAGIPPVLLNRVRNRRRQDMVSANADRLRAAMQTFSPPPVVAAPSPEASGVGG